MPRLLVLSILIVLIIHLSCAIKNFRLGRSKGGNLGSPNCNIPEDHLPPAQWFKQKKDHSTSTDLSLWKQRYFVNDSYYDFENPGPVFLMIGGEGPADPRWMLQGAWIDYARQFNALCINLEHRYYGQSHPTVDLSVKNLQFLSSHQALADLAYFITAMNEKLKLGPSVKWIAFGGSYPGSLAAWLRLKYPHLVFGAISSSGPVLAKSNFMEYFQVVIDALHQKTGNEDCVNQLKIGFKKMTLKLETNPEMVAKDFRVCTSFKEASTDDMKNFFNSIADDFADLVQYNEDNRISADKKFSNLSINTVCEMLTEPDSCPYKKLAEFNSLSLDKNKETCLDYDYKNMIQELRNTSLASEGARQWMYQTCTEFGFYQTSSAEVDVFGNEFNLDFFVQQCIDVFGHKFNKKFIESGTKWTNSYYGGMNIAVDRVVFVHGSVDPWHALGITKTLETGASAIYIQGTAHCANMYPPSDNDLKSLRLAREEIAEHLRAWVRGP